MNSLKLLFCISALLMSNLLLSQDCIISTDYEQHSCSSYTFFEENQIELQWNVNGQFYQSGAEIDFDTSAIGTYEICGFYETFECPNSPHVCDTIVISKECFENECEFNVEIEQESCAGYHLYSSEKIPLDWFINDDFQSTGIDFDFFPDAPGTYQICAVNEGCPPETNFCETFVITEECFESDCDFNVEIEQQSCSGYNLFSTTKVPLDWFINDDFQSTGIEFDFFPNAPGTYQICAVNEGCPAETNFCETFVITEDCFETVNIDKTLQDSEITIRPSITKSDFIIDGLSGNCIIKILDQNGRILFQTKVNGSTETNCDISHLLPGLYYVSIQNTENKFKYISRVIKM